MKQSLAATVIILLWPAIRLAAVSEKGQSEFLVSAPETRVSVYAVPLRCPLVEGLGCGSMAKPFLTELESKPSVAEAWIDHSGTRLALVWKADATPQVRAGLVKEITTQLNELSGSTREAALREIRSGSHWYRAGNVDELSREEAETVAGRLLDLVDAAEPLAQPKREILRTSFSEILKRKFIVGELSDQEACEELLKAARPQLGERGIQALDKALRDACCAPAEID